MTQEELVKIQEYQLEIMDEIHRLCVEYNIVYYIIGGTLLGAVRHGGFIPWDIDIDIAMPRDAYSRFKNVCNEQLDERFVYRDYTNTNNFEHPHAVVCKRNTELHFYFEQYDKPKENLGIYVDIFPLDNAPADKKLQVEQAQRLLKLNKIARAIAPKFYSNSRIKKFVKKVLKNVYRIGNNMNSLNCKREKIMQMYDANDTPYLCSMASHYSYTKQCMDKNIYGTPQLIKFADREYYAPAEIDTYLKRIYNNYMELPPVEKRNGNLNVITEVVIKR